jgi:hypothetical protein
MMNAVKIAEIGSSERNYCKTGKWEVIILQLRAEVPAMRNIF